MSSQVSKESLISKQEFGKVTIFAKHYLDPGASTVKWTALDPCSGLRESDPKLYTNF